MLIARAATPLAEIESALAAKQQMLAFEPADWGALFGAPRDSGRGRRWAALWPPIACGPRRVLTGAVRDSLLGCRFVNGAGEIIRAGSRVMKNVTGFDMPKLMCGAFGTLGVMTELTFKLAPRPPHAAALALKNFRAGRWRSRLCAAPRNCRSRRPALPICPRRRWRRARPRAMRALRGAKGAAFVRVEGAAEPLGDKLAHLAREFAGRDATVLDEAADRIPVRRNRQRPKSLPGRKAICGGFACRRRKLPRRPRRRARSYGSPIGQAAFCGWNLPATTEIAIAPARRSSRAPAATRR